MAGAAGREGGGAGYGAEALLAQPAHGAPAALLPVRRRKLRPCCRRRCCAIRLTVSPKLKSNRAICGRKGVRRAAAEAQGSRARRRLRRGTGVAPAARLRRRLGGPSQGDGWRIAAGCAGPTARDRPASSDAEAAPTRL